MGLVGAVEGFAVFASFASGELVVACGCWMVEC